ncbi:MAG TPA: pyridoxamine 5'-phosphate oxidase [Solimonas sp.]|nr:pyridoxamine 5'-phosphate oxidase [Solimonas sp.]
MQYQKNPPMEAGDLLADPLAQLEHWLAEATAAGQIEPTAMTLATAGPDGAPSARIVLFKGFHDGGLTFYTNYQGRKGRELAADPRAALVFWWDRLERQVRVEGQVERLPREMSERYFHTRPRASQLGALASHQSAVVATRAELDRRLAEAIDRYKDAEVPLPESWGGYVLRPQSFEFWQGRRDRLHDRIVFRRDGDSWRTERLEP